MYWTPLKAYLWEQMLKKVKWNKTFFLSKVLHINKNFFPCLVVELRSLPNNWILNRMTSLFDDVVLCYFQNLNEDLKLKFTFDIIEVDLNHHVSRIYANTTTFAQSLICENHTYWLVPINTFKTLNPQINDYFFVN